VPRSPPAPRHPSHSFGSTDPPACPRSPVSTRAWQRMLFSHSEIFSIITDVTILPTSLTLSLRYYGQVVPNRQTPGNQRSEPPGIPTNHAHPTNTSPPAPQTVLSPTPGSSPDSTISPTPAPSAPRWALPRFRRTAPRPPRSAPPRWRSPRPGSP